MEVEAAQAETRIAGAARQAFWLLRIGFTVAPILFGLDKFFNWTVHWPDYLAVAFRATAAEPAIESEQPLRTQRAA